MDFIIISIAVLGFAFFLWIGYVIGRKIERSDWVQNRLEPVVKERIRSSRAVLGGQFSEQLAPYLPGFSYSPTECRFIGKPIDFIVFKGMDRKEIEEIIFVEVKSGRSKAINRHERMLRQAVEDKRVRWEKYDVPDGVVEERGPA